jgi:putative transposase
MHAEKSNFTISRMARLLGVSRSGYYAWLGRLPSDRALRRERIEAKIVWFHGASDEVSGSPRILADLRADGEIISAKTVAAAMRRLGLRGNCPKKWRSTTLTDAQDSYPPDAATRAWDTGTLNRVWVGDITYLRTWQGWLYLATVIDAHSCRVIGSAIDEHMRADLVEQALQMAITLRGELPARVVFHTDRGTQYASAQIAAFAADNGITRSMGLTGICWDCETGRIVLRDVEDRVLLPEHLAYQDPRPPRGRSLDRGPLQPPQTTLLDRPAHPGGLRDATLQPPRGRSTSRIILCPPSGVKARVAAAHAQQVRVKRSVVEGAAIDYRGHAPPLHPALRPHHALLTRSQKGLRSRPPGA